jgi:alpha-beta hydrolase superfamily lysophospholipase
VTGELLVLVDLVQTTTRDGLRLDGAFLAASGTPALNLDAVCLLHGTGGNFYSSTLFDSFAERFLALGCSVLRSNTRGHDGISTAVTARGGRRLGAAYEVLDECRHDVAAWIDWLKSRTGPRIGLVGHSSGAVKALYAMAHEPQLGAACVVALSPPRLSYSWFCSSSQGPQFLETFALAERHVREGRPTALLEVTLPLPFVITAAGYVEKYGPDERYNVLRFAAAVPCPTLVTLGGVEVDNNMAFQGLPAALAELAVRQSRLSVEVIPGADHFYTDVRPEVVARVEAWLRQLRAR